MCCAKVSGLVRWGQLSTRLPRAAALAQPLPWRESKQSGFAIGSGMVLCHLIGASRLLQFIRTTPQASRAVWHGFQLESDSGARDERCHAVSSAWAYGCSELGIVCGDGGVGIQQVPSNHLLQRLRHRLLI